MDVGVIGSGNMGGNHIRIYNELKSVDTVYIYDTNEKSMKDIEIYYENYGYNVYACKSLKSLISAVDAISVCVPTQFHKDVVSEIANENFMKDILIEKPICSSTKDAIEIMKLFSKDTNIIGVGHVERFNPIVSEIAKIVKDPLYVEFKRHNPSSSRIMNTDVVEDLMIHDIDIMRELFCKCPTSIHSAGNDDIHSATIMSGLTQIYLSASRKSSKKIRSIYIEMEEFTLEADYMTQEVAIYSKPDRFKIDKGRYTQENLVEKVMVKKVEPLREELKVFIECSKHHIPFPVSMEDGVNNMMICDAIRKIG
jgi:predicted dehydrogenase